MVYWLGFGAFTVEAQVQSLVRKLLHATWNGQKANKIRGYHKTSRREHRQDVFDINSNKCFLGLVSQGNKNKSKKKQMGPNQTYKFCKERKPSTK